VDLSRVFRQQTVTLDLKSPDKEAAIGDLMDLLVAAGDVPDRQVALAAVLERENKMSTGMQNGIAIPHGKTDSVSDIAAAVGVCRKGIEFQSLDGKPTHIVLLTVSPQTMAGLHVQFLAEVGRLFANAAIRDGILRARSREELIGILTSKG
jgi:mannitol/fructose-specific phosphotransferase system IIA component (Ntr-type)